MAGLGEVEVGFGVEVVVVALGLVATRSIGIYAADCP